MHKLTETVQELQTAMDESLKALSAKFATIHTLLKSADIAAADQSVNELFRMYLETHRKINGHLKLLMAEADRQEKKFGELHLEKEQFKALYDTCVLFASESELEGLIAFAMDQLTYHLQADRGFLILINERGDTEYLVSRNFEGETIDEPAREVSKTVIRQTLDILEPIKVDHSDASDQLIRQGSFVRLGLCSVLSVPVIYRKQLLGVVYLDRKEGAVCFTDRDLAFLAAFARQIAFRINELKELQTAKSDMERRDRSRLQGLRAQHRFEEIIGKSDALTRVLEICAKVAATDATVLILGESGVGKELIARALHFNSDRFEGPMIAVNCGAIPADLLESELFGYEPGAFTGAVKAKPGRFELAHRGTLFLDEIAELSVNLQAKILRVIQTREIERLGGTGSKKIDIRLIAATNKDLARRVREGKFREDLYYRLKVVVIEVPPLRERKDDIQLLVNYFIRKYGEHRVTAITDEALEVLENYRWDGNIRELENVIQRAIVLAGSSMIGIADLPAEIASETGQDFKAPSGQTLDEAEAEFRKWFIIRTLRKTGNNKAKAAELLGVNRSHFFKILNQVGIKE